MSNKDNKHKLRKILIWVISSLFMLLIVSFLIIIFAIRDPNRNNNIDTGITSEEVINKEYVSSLANTSSSFSYSLSDEDINIMLADSLKKEEVSKKISSIYYSVSGDTHTWYVDLNIPLVKTRVKINTHFINQDFVIDNMTMGKLDVTKRKLPRYFVNDSILNKIFENANLPIKANLDEGIFKCNPLGFISFFDKQELTNEMFSLANNDNVVSYQENKIGFTLDLSSLVVDKPNIDESSYDLESELTSKLEEITYSSLSNSEARKVLEVSENNFSRYISSFFSDEYVIERHTSNLVSVEVNAKVDLVNVSFKNNSLEINFFIKLGNTYFLVNFPLEEGLAISESSFSLAFHLKENKTSLESSLLSYFLSNVTKSEYISYVDSSELLLFDFTSLVDGGEIDPLLSLAFKEMKIESNSLIFTLSK